jgi:hypothetical protein
MKVICGTRRTPGQLNTLSSKLTLKDTLNLRMDAAGEVELGEGGV